MGRGRIFKGVHPLYIFYTIIGAGINWHSGKGGRRISQGFQPLYKLCTCIQFSDSGRSSPEGSYSQLKPPRSVTSSMTPHLPPLLQQTVLNQEPPSQVPVAVHAWGACMRKWGGGGGGGAINFF